MKKICTAIAFITISLGLNAQDQTINGTLTLNSNADAIMSFNNTDNSWQYFQFSNNGLRKTWMGLDNLNNFNIVKENGGYIYLGGANIGIGVSTPLEKLQVVGNIRLSGNVISYGTGKFTNASDAQISLYSPDTWAGIDFKDINGRDFLWFNGQHKTFAIGGGGSNISGKKLHIEGGTSIGVGYRVSTVPTNGLAVEGSVGIGKSNPQASLDVAGNILVKSGEKISWGTEGYTSIEGSTVSNKLQFRTNNAFAMIIDSNQNVGIGTSSPDSKLSVNGKIHTKEVKVDLVGWPDYVFSKNYQLPSLKSVEKHIKENGHLANIPSAEEVAKNGIELGLMNKKLLEKIEELTLYTIQQEKKIATLEQHKELIEQQSKKIKNLENKINSILQHLKK